jgi:3D-(3,5/4)-trihydroxycyclohexane-1,2-dione acylhydrolase (decyclizing)
VIVMVGDGSYLMMAQELVTAVAEGYKLTVVLVQNHGYQSIGALSESVGSQRFGTRYRYRDTDRTLPVDLAANAASLGADVVRATTVEELEAALRDARASSATTVIHVETDPLVGAPDSGAWWDVPVAAVSELDSTRAARSEYERNKRTQQSYLSTHERVETP